MDPVGLSFGQGASGELLRRLELTVNRRLDGVLQGDYRGLVPGHGSELGETRAYQPGDDVRRIDWNVTARTQTAHVRETIADRELETWVLVDRSASMHFGTAQYEKRELAAIALAAVGFLTARTGNRLGAVFAGDGPALVTPARGGRTHLLSVLHRALTQPAATAPRRQPEVGPPGADRRQEGLAASMERMAALHRRRGLAVVISDFLDPAPGSGNATDAPGWIRPLRRLAARHETLAIEVIDPRELELPAVGVLTLVDPETGRRREVQTSSAKLRARYAAAAIEQRQTIAAHIMRSGADHLVLRTDGDWLAELIRFVALRRERAARLPRRTS
ncbi:MAG: DUF58 domain-containing protein [Acidimicrobiales bacterium]